MTFHVYGSTGRLGRALVEGFKLRGDLEGSLNEPLNYLVFAHRYRGKGGIDAEFDAQVIKPLHIVNNLTPADGDKCIVFVSSVVAESPRLDASISYVTCKAALNGMSRYLSLISSFRVNTVSPDAFTGPNPVMTIDQVVKTILKVCSPECNLTGRDIKVEL